MKIAAALTRWSLALTVSLPVVFPGLASAHDAYSERLFAQTADAWELLTEGSFKRDR